MLVVLSLGLQYCPVTTAPASASTGLYITQKGMFQKIQELNSGQIGYARAAENMRQ